MKTVIEWPKGEYVVVDNHERESEAGSLIERK